MKKFIVEFLRRGWIASGIGPVVLAILYLVLQHCGQLQSLSVSQVCTGIFSIMALAFAAGGMNALYQIERLPLMAAILIHGAVLYVSYLGVYMINDWLEAGRLSILIFTAVFVLGYLIIWTVIYGVVRRNTNALNEGLRKKQSQQGSPD